MKSKCDNCSFIFKTKTVEMYGGEMEVGEPICPKCGSNSLTKIEVSK